MWLQFNLAHLMSHVMIGFDASYNSDPAAGCTESIMLARVLSAGGVLTIQVSMPSVHSLYSTLAIDNQPPAVCCRVLAIIPSRAAARLVRLVQKGAPWAARVRP